MTDVPAQAPKKSKLPLILAGCGGCGCLSVLGFLALVIGIPFLMTQGAVEAAERHVRLVREGDAAAAYGVTSTVFQESTSVEAFEGFVAANPGIYTATDLSFNSRSVNNDRAKLEGTASGPEGEQRVRFLLRQEGGGWRVEGVERLE